MNGSKARDIRAVAQLTLPEGTEDIIVKRHYRRLKRQYKQELKTIKN